MTSRFYACLVVLSAIVAASPAAAGDVRRSACRDEMVLDFITGHFRDKASAYLQLDLGISAIDEPRSSRILLRDTTHRVGREYCHATATTTDGEKRALWYLIESDWSFASLGSSVEFCLSGLDPWHVYGAQCASLR